MLPKANEDDKKDPGKKEDNLPSDDKKDPGFTKTQNPKKGEKVKEPESAENKDNSYIPETKEGSAKKPKIEKERPNKKSSAKLIEDKKENGEIKKDKPNPKNAGKNKPLAFNKDKGKSLNPKTGQKPTSSKRIGLLFLATVLLLLTKKEKNPEFKY